MPIPSLYPLTDLLDFADHWVTANTFTSFGALIADFQNTGMDVYYAGKVSEAVEVPCAGSGSVENKKLRTLSIMVSNTYGRMQHTTTNLWIRRPPPPSPTVIW